jgi:putative hemolysin
MAEKFIDIKRLIKEKNPGLAKWMPGFAIRYMKNILHEDFINDFLDRHSDEYGVNFCDKIIEEFDIKTTVYGKEHIPEKGGCIFAANHPLGGMDAIIIVSAIKDKRLDIKFIVNDVLLNLENLKDLFVGVNKFGKNLTQSLRKVDETFASDQAVFVFPAGLVSRKVKGEVRDLKWKKTFVTRARKYNQPIVPVYIDGRLSNFFYNFANIRTSLGVKKNIEMFYLVNELFKQKGSEVDLVFGEMITPDMLDDNKSDHEWAEQIKAKVYEMQRSIKRQT